MQVTPFLHSSFMNLLPSIKKPEHKITASRFELYIIALLFPPQKNIATYSFQVDRSASSIQLFVHF